MSIYLLIGTAIWLYVLSVLKRARLSAFYFIAGSAGLFLVLMSLADPYWVWLFTHAVIHGVNLIAGDLLGWVQITIRTGMVYINNPTNVVQMSIDFECSGIIESTALIALISFFPTYTQLARGIYRGLEQRLEKKES